MKYVLAGILVFPLIIFAQKNERDVLNPDQLKVKEWTLEAQRTAPSIIRLPFSKIKILDSRFDTSKIGYLLAGALSKKRMFRKLILVGGCSNAIVSYYNDYYRNSFAKNDFELLIVMKRFWLSGEDAKSNNKRVEAATSFGNDDNFYCKWEYYLGRGGKYLPIKRMDTVINISTDVSKYIEEEFSENKQANLKYTLKTLIEILDYSNAVERFDKLAHKTLAEIEAYNRKMNEIPVLQVRGFKKGVYLNFEEFKNNNPSITEFREKKMRYGMINTENYLENLNGETISNYWGYSDGNDFRYGMMGNEKIYRIQNTFCFFMKVVGHTIVSGYEKYNNAGSDVDNIGKEKFEIWVPFQIDMETGEVY